MDDKPEKITEQQPATQEKSNKQILLKVVILLALVAAVLGIWGLRNSSDKPKTTTASSATQPSPAKINITMTGFQPATIQVKVGTQISWVNTDSVPHQVAADPFPKDDSISGFNSTIILQHNDTYSYTFDKVGTYTYHDDRHPLQLNGVVIVK